VWNFSAGWTAGGSNEGLGQDGYGMASMLLGTPATYNFRQVIRTANAWANQTAYVQDDVRVTAKLTLNLGLRWDYRSADDRALQPRLVLGRNDPDGWKYNPAFRLQSRIAATVLLPATARFEPGGQEFTG